ncbi:prolow-density lipoprotein receptor-related protein 1 [Colossoma macropomum]|uniref:prolow-density lipoprotein receptor-related protein 1 n=1 Tax=Colossoma macropomum TaxID=42526 RepID=UPI001864B9E6|nr:prolow-density lipoprotein receptor-related protein 1 [Colossoma macropomum]
MYHSPGVAQKCGNGRWQCDDGQCIPRRWRCDGSGDCLDGSDEMNCSCPQEDFECADATMCVTKSAVCDGRPQCRDGSDELNCNQTSGCLLGDWACRNRVCIPQELRCNGVDDCGDRSDEEGCGPCGDLSSIETVKTDGTGRHTFKEFFNGRTTQSLAVFSGWFYWSDGKRLWQAPQTQPDQKSFVLKAALPILTVYHELQQPRGSSPCRKSDCQLCLPSLAIRGSFTCSCPKEKLPVAQGSCESFKLAYATSTSVYTMEYTTEGPVKSLLFTSDEDIQAFDIDWKRGWVIWANGTACTVKVDQKTGNLYWVSCDDLSIGVTHIILPDESISQQLYQASEEINDVFMDWQRGQLYWLEDELQVMSLLKMRKYSAGKKWSIPDLIVAAYEPFMVTMLNDVITLWKRQDGTRVWAVSVESGVFGVTIAMKEVKQGDFLCKDRKCVNRALVCDGHSDCADGSDEVGCPTSVANTSKEASVRCRLGSKPCKDSSECVLLNHVCDGEVDCKDGSDEEGCEHQCRADQFHCAHGRKCIDKKQVCDGTPQCQDRSDEMNCFTRSENCNHHCDNKTRCIPENFLCDGERDCVDGTDEADCPSATVAPSDKPSTETSCKSPSVLCEGTLLCINQSQLCDGKLDCPDGSDEFSCPTCPLHCDEGAVCLTNQQLCDGKTDCRDGSDETNCYNQGRKGTAASSLKCPLGFKPCRDGSDCILTSHVCDGEKDCKDGSDESDCKRNCKKGQFLCTNKRRCIERAFVCDGYSDCSDGSDELQCPTCPLHCDEGTVCLTSHQLCDGKMDCRDGLDERDCCQFQCGNGRLCIERKKVCDGTAQCQDHSDEVNCCSHPCDKNRCIPETFLCDGERDCADSSDEADCRGFLCKDTRKCIERYLVCDGQPDCTDGSDEVDCPSVAVKATDAGPLRCRLGSKLCKDGSDCVLLSHVCDGEMDCKDGSDEEGCDLQCNPAPLKCRLGLKPCKDGSDCILYSHVCDGEVDCKDGSDEEDCDVSCRAGQFQCAHGKKCIDSSLVCDGKPQCQDRSDEMDCFTRTKSCSHRCDNKTRCIPENFMCDGEKDCVDGSDEADCALKCAMERVTVPDGFDEESCLKRCPKRGDFLCKDKRKCVERSLVCDGRSDCVDGSDEVGCPTVASKTSMVAPLGCRLGTKRCKDGTECVLLSHVCDGEVDCKDGSDEEECEHQCRAGRFQCAHGRKCIDMKQVCDGTPQCQDRSDEMNCFKLSEDCYHHCDNRSRCLPKSFVCDGERDCFDGTDETGCAPGPCWSGQFQCVSGQCVSTKLRCDGHADCHDHSDEKGCRKPPHCPLGERCPNSHECLLKEWLCDGHKDCTDGSDEQNCKSSVLQCGEFQWSCASKIQCVPSSWRCDGTRDCKDQSDEAGCGKVKCPTHLFQCVNEECVNPELVCDGVTHCQDGSDEGLGCLNNCSSSRRPQCEHYCISTPQGAKCGCRAGFKLQADGLFCVDIDECKDTQPPVCSHKCHNTHGSYVCQCQPGFLLEPDGSTCKSPEEPHLLAAVQFELLFKDLRSGNLQILLPPGQTPIFSLDYDWMEQKLFWVNLEEESIKFAVHGDKGNIKALVKGVKSDSIAVDWVGRNLYWVDGVARQILAVRLGSSVVKPQNYIVIVDEDLEQPRSLVLLPQKGMMLWSEIGSEPRIERAGMDSSQRKVVLRHSLSWPVAMAVDILTDRMYWTDEKLKHIASATLDGEDIRILQLTETPSPFSVAVFNDMVYWSDTQRRAILGAHKTTGKNCTVILKRPGQPFGLKVVHPLMQPKLSRPCESLRCSHICLLTPGLQAVCRCPAGLLLAKDGVTCSPLEDSSSFLLMLSPSVLTQIYTRSLRGEVGLKQWPEHRALALPGINGATGIDLVLQDNMLYLADSSQPSVAQLKLEESGLVPEGDPLQLLGDTVTALAVDWITHNLYWSSIKQPQIYVSSPGWKYTAMVVQAKLQDTTSIALHPPTGRLCFTAVELGDSKILPQVDCASMNGQNRMVLWKKTQMPMFLTFSSQGSTVYWADISAEVIASVDIDGSNYREYKTGPPLIVSFARSENILFWVTLYNGTTKVWYSDGVQPKKMWFEVQTNIVALKAFSKHSQKGSNLCAENNGGCSQLCLAYPGGRTCHCTQGYLVVNATQCVSSPECPAGSKPCRNGHECLSSVKFCDRVPDCHDGSDEEDCTYMKVKPGFKHRKPSAPGSAGIAGSPQDNEVLVRTLGGQSCNSELCNGRGRCVMHKGEPGCECVQGYSGTYCQEGGSSSAPVVLSVLFIIAIVIAAAVILKRRRDKEARGQPTDKETLMKDMEEHEEPEAHPQNFVNELYNPKEELFFPLTNAFFHVPFTLNSYKLLTTAFHLESALIAWSDIHPVLGEPVKLLGKRDMPSLTADLQRLMDCSAQRCNGRGECVTVDGLPECECMLGYRGDTCRETVNGGLSVPLTLGVLGVLVGLIIVAFLFAYFRQKRKAQIREQAAAAKEALKRNGDVHSLPHSETGNKSPTV